MSGMMEARTSKILYSLPSSNFPQEPNSYLNLWFPHIVSLFGKEYLEKKEEEQLRRSKMQQRPISH